MASTRRTRKRSVSLRAFRMLADLLDVKADQLLICRDLIDSGEAYYKWEIPKASGGTRKITSPKEELKTVQRKILERILYALTVHFIAHGFTRSRDIMTNAGRHQKAKSILNLDLKDAFPSTRSHRIAENLAKPLTRILRQQFGDNIAPKEINDITYMLVRLSTYWGRLPQGAPTSPALLNIVCLNLDQQLYSIALNHNLTVTRYADDITFSSETDSIDPEVRRKIFATVSNAGWKVNHKKTTYSTRGLGHALEVTGLQLLETGKVTIPARRRERYVEYFRQLHEQAELSSEDRARAIGIVVYASRVYNGHLPSSLQRPWTRLKAKFKIADAPAPKGRIDVNVYAPDLPDRRAYP